MTRKKMKLAFITNDTARKATFKKRKKGLLKKLDELTTLCAVDACAIIYSPYDPQPQVWPDPLTAERVLCKLKRLPEMEQRNNMINQEQFLMQRVAKARAKLKKLQRENNDKETNQALYECLADEKRIESMNLRDLCDLRYVIYKNLKEIQKRYDKLKEHNKKRHRLNVD